MQPWIQHATPTEEAWLKYYFDIETLLIDWRTQIDQEVIYVKPTQNFDPYENYFIKQQLIEHWHLLTDILQNFPKKLKSAADCAAHNFFIEQGQQLILLTRNSQRQVPPKDAPYGQTTYLRYLPTHRAIDGSIHAWRDLDGRMSLYILAACGHKPSQQSVRYIFTSDKAPHYLLQAAYHGAYASTQFTRFFKDLCVAADIRNPIPSSGNRLLTLLTEHRKKTPKIHTLGFVDLPGDDFALSAWKLWGHPNVIDDVNTTLEPAKETTVLAMSRPFYQYCVEAHQGRQASLSTQLNHLLSELKANAGSQTTQQFSLNFWKQTTELFNKWTRWCTTWQALTKAELTKIDPILEQDRLMLQSLAKFTTRLWQDSATLAGHNAQTTHERAKSTLYFTPWAANIFLELDSKIKGIQSKNSNKQLTIFTTLNNQKEQTALILMGWPTTDKLQLAPTVIQDIPAIVSGSLADPFRELHPKTTQSIKDDDRLEAVLWLIDGFLPALKETTGVNANRLLLTIKHAYSSLPSLAIVRQQQNTLDQWFHKILTGQAKPTSAIVEQDAHNDKPQPIKPPARGNRI